MSFDYEGYTVAIVPEMRKGKQVYWFYVNSHAISFVSSEALAASLAVRFIDVLDDEHFKTSKKTYIFRQRGAKAIM